MAIVGIIIMSSRSLSMARATHALWPAARIIENEKRPMAAALYGSNHGKKKRFRAAKCFREPMYAMMPDRPERNIEHGDGQSPA